ncbi:hypothetical protein F5Y15DRAFT_413806 [Xylariaceae sp. FL0016]|nr:hypothetical protein F5Y15DRAFT_413806 [Xylariaceae sp. FL0016]
MDFWGFTAVEVFTLICLCLRMYGRRRITRTFGPEDYVMMSILVLFLVFTVLGKYATVTAMGVNIWTLGSHAIAVALKACCVISVFYLVLLSLTKVAILCFYLRIFPNRWFRIASWITVTWVAVSTAVLIFLSIFQCMPINYNWEGWKGEITDFECIDVNALSYAAAGLAIAQEIAILILPLPLLLKLNTTWRKRASIIVMFSLGVFVLITSCVRLRYLLTYARSSNPTWDYTDAVLWSGIEVNVSIIVASLPAIRQLLTQLLPRAFGSTSNISTRSRPRRPRQSRITSEDKSTETLTRRNRNISSRMRESQSRLSGVFEHWTSRLYEDAGSWLDFGVKTRGSLRTEIVAEPELAETNFYIACTRSSVDRNRIQVLTTISSDTAMHAASKSNAEVEREIRPDVQGPASM